MIVGSTYRMRFYCTYLTQTSINQCDFRVLSITAGAPLDSDVCSALSGFVGVFYKPCLNQVATYHGADLRLLSTGPVPLPVNSTTGSGAGTGGADPLPTQVCGIFTKNSGTTGRANRGRFYVAFPSLADMTAGNEYPTLGYTAKVFNLSGQVTGPRNLVVPSGTLNIEWGLGKTGASLAFVPTPSATARRLWATQRRRGDYGRPNPPPF